MDEIIEIIENKWIEILGVLMATLTFLFYLLDRNKKNNKDKNEQLKSIQPRFEEYSSKTNGNEWTLYFINKGSTAKSIELVDPLGEFLKSDVKREVKTEVSITLEGKSAKKIQLTKDIPPYKVMLKCKNLAGNTYHQNIIRAQGSKSFYIKQPTLIK
jgi:hypothetical protein